MQFITEPWEHQRHRMNQLEAHRLNSWGFLWDMGTGKTKQAIDALRMICYRLNRVPKTLIIGPSAVQENWKREIELHSTLPSSIIQVIDGATKQDGTKLKSALKKRKLEQLDYPGKQIFICTTYTPKKMLKTKACKKTKRRVRVDWDDEVWGRILQAGFECIIVDEVHNFKDPTRTRTKGVHQLVNQPQLKYRFILTGSPVLQSALDLWSQFYILDPKILGRNFSEFRARYFYDRNAGMPSDKHFPDWQPKNERYFMNLLGAGVPQQEIEAMKLSSLNNIIYQHACRVMKNEVLDLPPRTYQTLKVGMSKEHRKIYNQFRDTLVTMVDAKRTVKKELDQLLESDIDLKENLPEIMSADLAIVKTLRLMQLASGVFTNDDGEITLLETEKLKELKATLETILANEENKVIIWTIFTPTYGQLMKISHELNAACVFLNGTQSKDEKQRSIDEFQNNKGVRVMIANPAAGGTGVNLTAANYEIDYSFGFKLGDWLQKDARAYRGGQTRSTHSISLVTEDTIEEKCLVRLQEKAEHAEDILARKDFSRNEIINMI